MLTRGLLTLDPAYSKLAKIAVSWRSTNSEIN